MMLVALTGGCASTVGVEERDTSGRFDGLWRVDLAKGTSQQAVSNWRFTCGDMSGEFYVEIEDGQMRIQMTDDPDSIHTAYVDRNGAFRLAAPTGTTTRASGTSDLSINAGENTLILDGDLTDSEGSGRYTWGVKEFGNAGCTTRFRMVKDPAQG